MRELRNDYRGRAYLSVGEVARYIRVPVEEIHRLVRKGDMPAFKSTGGQYRFRLSEVQQWQGQQMPIARSKTTRRRRRSTRRLKVAGTTQAVMCGDARELRGVADDSVHLAITSPPYFNAKMYSEDLPADLGNLHELDDWLEQTGTVWGEVLRTLQPGRKFFLNLMNLPVRENRSFRTLNLVGKTVDLCEGLGFIFKRDIVWHKTNGVRAHFGTYPHPGGILLNHMHEFILEFEKPNPRSVSKYAHVSAHQKEQSKLDRDFWLSLKNSDVWLMKPEKSGGSRSHCAPFPLELPRRLILAFSYVGETVLDPFAGSGTTLVAAAQCRRAGIGCEINPAFCEEAIQRITSEGNLLL